MKMRLAAMALSLVLSAAGGAAEASTFLLNSSYSDGGSFVGAVDFNADQSAVLGVNGTLFGYSSTGYTGNPSDSVQVNSYYGPSANGVTFNGGVWSGVTGGIAFDYTPTAGTPTYVDGFDGALPHYSFVSTGAFSPAVPEPATWAMMLLGVAGLGAALRSRRRDVTLAA